MKKLAVTIIACAAAVLFAPLRSSATGLEGGLKFGLNIAFLHGPDIKVWPDMQAGWVLRFGACGGGFVALPLSESVAIQAEALITTKGSKEVGALFEEAYNYSLMITYLEIPVLVRFAAISASRNFKLVLMAGPAFAFKLHTRFTLAGERLDFNGVRSNDLGLVISFGYVIQSKGYMEFRYTAGLSKVIEEAGVPLTSRTESLPLSSAIGSRGVPEAHLFSRPESCAPPRRVTGMRKPENDGRI
jgi:hypothetical protein